MTLRGAIRHAAVRCRTLPASCAPQGKASIIMSRNAWGAANKVEVNVDRITAVGAKLQLTGTAESQANTGHDMMTFIAWDPQARASKLAPRLPRFV